MSAIVREVVLKLRVEMANQGINIPRPVIPAPDTTLYESRLKKMKAETEHYINLDPAAHNARSQFELTSPGGKRSPTENGTNSEIVGKMRIAADAYKVAGEGALHLARGVAFLTAAGEEELQVVLRRIAYYQGLFDIFKGGTDLTKGMIVGTRAVAAAHTAAAAATAAHARFAAGHAAALTTSTVVMNAAAGAATRMWAALMGPIGWAALAAGVAYGAAKWVAYRQAVEDAEIEQSRLLKEQATLASIAKGRQDELNRSIEMRAQHADSASLRADKHGIEMGLIGNISQAGLGATAEEQRRAEIRAQEMTFKEKMALNARAMAEQARSNKLFQAEIVPKSTVQSEATMRQNLEAQKSLVAGQQAMNAFQRERLGLLGDERSRLQGLIAQDAQRHAANAQALKEEQDRRKSLIERIGAMDPGQLQQLKTIAQQIQTQGVGSLRQDQRDILRNSGVAQSLSEKLDLAKGEEILKGTDLFGIFGTFKPGTKSRPEGQGADQTYEDFLKQQQAEIVGSAKANRDGFDQVLKEQRNAADVLEKGLTEVSEQAGVVTRKAEAALNKFVALLEELANKVDSAAGRVAKIEGGALARHQ